MSIHSASRTPRNCRLPNSPLPVFKMFARYSSQHTRTRLSNKITNSKRPPMIFTGDFLFPGGYHAVPHSASPNILLRHPLFLFVLTNFRPTQLGQQAGSRKTLGRDGEATRERERSFARSGKKIQRLQPGSDLLPNSRLYDCR